MSFDKNRASIRIFFIFLMLISINQVISKNGYWFLKRSGLHINPSGDLLQAYELTRCSPNPCTGYVYGSAFYYLLKPFEVSNETLLVVGEFLIGLFLLTGAIFVAGLTNIYQKSFFVLILFSTPNQFLFANTNIDIICYLLAFFACVTRSRILAFVMISIAAIFKFYAVVAFMPFLIFYYLKKGFTGRFLIETIYIASLSALLMVEYLTNARVEMGPINAFGISVFAAWTEYLPARLKLSYLGTLTLVASGLIFIWLTRRMLGSSLVKLISQEFLEVIKPGTFTNYGKIPTTAKCQLVDLVFLVVGLTCFLMALNFDYRIAFFLIPLARLAILLKSKLLSLLVLASAYCTQYTFEQHVVEIKWMVQLLGDISLFVLSCILMASFVRMSRVLVRDSKDKQLE